MEDAMARSQQQASGQALLQSMDKHQPHIQIEDMGGVTNMTYSMSAIPVQGSGGIRTKAQSQLASDNHSFMAMTKGTHGADPSRLGHATRTTEYTSNVGHHTQDGGAISAMGGALSFNAPPGSVTPTVPGGATDGNTTILNYPYSYDQDQKHEVDFAERLYRANNEVQRASQDLYTASVEIQHNVDRTNALYPSASQQQT